MRRTWFFAALIALAVVAGPVGASNHQFDIMVKTDGATAWIADYQRTLPSGAGWTDGDRVGYRCAYAFLMNGGQVVGRVTFSRVSEAAAYVRINDEHMVEGARHYDGTVASGEVSQLNECPAPTQSYTSFSGDQRPVITYETGCAVLETRNYANLVPGAGVTFQQVESTDDRVTVVAYKNGLPIVVIYYDSMSPSVVMNSNL